MRILTSVFGFAPVTEERSLRGRNELHDEPIRRRPMMVVFWAFIYLSSFSAGIMLVLQVQHFGLYPLVGKEGFAAYVAATIEPPFFQRSSRRSF